LLDKFAGDKNQTPPIFSCGIPQPDCFVRFVVETPFETGGLPWKDAALISDWERYYMSTKTDKALCYVTGQVVPPSQLNPGKLRNAGDKAKLICTNDASGFTYRGRFTDELQVMQVGYEVSQKAHSALRWLIEKQGYRNGSQAIVAWSVQGAQLPPLLDDTDALFKDLPSDTETAYTDEILAGKLKSMIQGYRQSLNVTDRVVVMGIDSATPGRMSITFYRELLGSAFLDRIEEWHRTCSWKHGWKSRGEPDEKGKSKPRYFTFVGAPSPKDIAYAAYGMRVDDKLKKATVERILPCIIDAQPLPADIVQSVVNRAKMRTSFETKWEWNKVLSIACALYRKLNERKRYQMALEKTRTSRDYLYGRLLAVADTMEERALYQAGESRSTNAARMMNRFADHPFSTWRTLDNALSPYRLRLGRRANWYIRMIQDIMVLFSTDDFKNDSPLSGEYLLGYYCQRDALMKKKDPEETVNDVE
jgi:CRISPR-associated protein Csd1